MQDVMSFRSLVAEGFRKKADYDLIRSGLSPDGIPHAAFINGHNGMYAYGPEHMISPDYAWDGKPVNPASERYSPRPAAKAPAKPAQFSMGGSSTTSMNVGNAAKGLTFSGPDGMNFMSSPVNPTRNFSNGGTFTVGNAPAGMTVSTPKPGTASISPSGAAAKAPVKPQAQAAPQQPVKPQAPAAPAKPAAPAPAAKPAARPAVAPRPKPMARPRVLRGKAGLIGGLLTAAGLGAGAYAMSKIPAAKPVSQVAGTVTPNGPAPEPQQKDLDLTSANAYNKALNEGRKSDAHMIQRMNTPQQKDLTGIEALRAAGAMPDQVRGPQNSGNPFTGESGLTPGLNSGVTT